MGQDGTEPRTDAEGILPTTPSRKCALYLRSVCVPCIAFRGLRCHPLTCISLKLLLSVDSSPAILHD
jgi:hypothetical protein